ncbi:MAG: histidine phosphatase family protein [Lachnospiraceae bacterium]|nr:histidine phosphatase family protein [Lachnospiraceae bacterium]
MLRVDLIRHGQTGGNAEKRYVGRTDEPLCPEGILKLLQTAERQKHGKSDPQLIFSSPMLRCIQTAKLLYPEGKIRVLEGLRETDFGSFEYKTYEELKDNREYRAWIESAGTLPCPGGESMEDVKRRSLEAFEEAVRICTGERLSHAAFVIHGGTIMGLLETLGIPRKSGYDWMVSNGEGYSGWWNEEKHRIEIERKWP